MSHQPHIGSAKALATVFREAPSLYSLVMSIFMGWGARARGLFTDSKGPWGSGDSGEPASDDGKGGGQSGGPWGEPARKPGRTTIGPGSNVSSLDELFRRGRAR